MYNQKSKCIFLFYPPPRFTDCTRLPTFTRFNVASFGARTLFFTGHLPKEGFKLCTADTLRWDATHTSSAFKLRTLLIHIAPPFWCSL